MRFPSISRTAPKGDKAPAIQAAASHEVSREPFAMETNTTESFLDSVDGKRVIGWAYDAAAPGQRLLIEVSAGDEVQIVLANLERMDLVEAGKGDGRHGFVATLDLGQSATNVVHARIASSGQELAGSPRSTDVVDLISNLGEGRLRECLRSEAYLARGALKGAVSVEAAVAYPTRAQPDKLFAVAAPESDPEGIISRYLEFECNRSQLGQTFSIDRNLTERLKVLHWYLSGDGPQRKLQLPLSRRQIEFLNAPVPIIGLGVEVSIAAYSFIIQERGEYRDLKSDVVLRDALYWWCIQRSILIAPGGELVTPTQVRTLTAVGPEDADKEYPLNYYARRTVELDPSLSFLNLVQACDRALLVCVLILRSARSPYLAQFLPRACVAQLLRTPPGETASNLERMLTLALTAESSPMPDGLREAAAFRSLLENHLKQAGFSLSWSASDRRAGCKDAAHCFVNDPGILPGLESGIAVIGPTRATSGLGQATRLSIEVLNQSSFKPAVLEFGLGNPAPVGFASTIEAPQLRTPRQINLIHLNAQSIPLAFVYLNRAVYDRSYNIGYVFWELDQVPKCHHLALDMLDEIWVASEYNREIYERFATIPVRNVGMAAKPLADVAPLPRKTFGVSSDEFVFLATFDSFSFVERKNPLAVLAAFQQAFPAGSVENVLLILKTHNRTRMGDPHQLRIWRAVDDIVAHDARIRVVDETLGYGELLAFKKACDCYVSLHRSEGLGLGLIEAMQLGIPVIATAYSGNMDFCTPENCFLVDYELVAPMPSEYIYVERGSRWAEPSVAAAAALMRQVFTDPHEARGRAQAAARQIEQRFDIGSIARRYEGRLREIQTIMAAANAGEAPRPSAELLRLEPASDWALTRSR